MNRIFGATMVVVAAAVLAGCSPRIPDSNRGVGFGDPVQFERERAQRDAALSGSGAGSFAAPVPVTTQAIPSGDLAAAGIGVPVGGGPLTALDPNRTQGLQQAGGLAVPAGTPGLPVGAAVPAPVATSNPAISDEQDFEAVAARETIQSDAQRIAQNAARMQVVQPTAVPERPADAGPNIVQYALSAPNRKGQEWYSRSIFATQGRFQRNCAEYNSPDAAQRDFLARGGPDRDPRGLDPDGDGFACGWDPAPFLAAAGR